MIDLDSDHYRIVEQSLCGHRSVDEHTLASLAILGERLERVKKLGGLFEHVRFSPAAKRLKQQKNVAAVT